MTPKCQDCKRDQDDCVCAYRLNPVVIDQIIRQQEEIDALRKERDSLQADLAMISEELGLPPTIGPSAGWIRKMRDDLRNLNKGRGDAK